MPWVPFLNSHREQVKILFDLFKQRDGLNNVLILSLDICGDFTSGEGVTKTQADSHKTVFIEIY